MTNAHKIIYGFSHMRNEMTYIRADHNGLFLSLNIICQFGYEANKVFEMIE